MELDRKEGAHFADSLLVGILGSHLKQGQIITETGLERPLLIINDLPEWRFFPDGVGRRVPVDGEVTALTEALVALAADPGLRSRMSAEARTFYEREGSIGRMAERYLDVVARTSGTTGEN